MKGRIFDPSSLEFPGGDGEGAGGSKLEEVEVEPVGLGDLAGLTPDFVKDHLDKIRTAFKNLPPWGDFVKGRDSDMLRMRQDFTERLQAMHTRTLAKHTGLKTAQAEAQAHALWTERQALQAKRHHAEAPRLPCPACEVGA